MCCRYGIIEAYKSILNTPFKARNIALFHKRTTLVKNVGILRAVESYLLIRFFIWDRHLHSCVYLVEDIELEVFFFLTLPPSDRNDRAHTVYRITPKLEVRRESAPVAVHESTTTPTGGGRICGGAGVSIGNGSSFPDNCNTSTES